MIFFYLFSSLLLIYSVLVIFSNHPVISLILFIESFLAAPFLLFILECDFLALIFITIYVGGWSKLVNLGLGCEIVEFKSLIVTTRRVLVSRAIILLDFVNFSASLIFAYVLYTYLDTKTKNHLPSFEQHKCRSKLCSAHAEYKQTSQNSCWP